GPSLPGVIERDEVAAAVLPDALEELAVLGCVAGRDPSALVHVAEQRREVLDAEVRGEIPRPTGSVVVSGGGGPSGHGSVHIGADGLGPGEMEVLAPHAGAQRLPVDHQARLLVLA